MNIYKNDNQLFIMDKLSGLKNSLNNNTLNLSYIKKQIDDISKFKSMQNYDYLKDLLEPETRKGVKIPTDIPIPSCSFQLHDIFITQTNASGNFSVVLNPCFLASTDMEGEEHDIPPAYQSSQYTGKQVILGTWASTLFRNSNVSLDGIHESENWITRNIGQTLPSVYSKYRLVSAAVHVQYMGDLTEASGIIGGAVVFDEDPVIGCDYKVKNGGSFWSSDISPQVKRCSVFQNIRQSAYYQENNCLEGLRMLYFPIDNSYEEFIDVFNGHTLFLTFGQLAGALTVNFNLPHNYYRSGFRWVMFGQGLPALKENIKIELFANFECLPMPELLNYIPIEVNAFKLHPEVKKKIYEELRKNVVKKLNNFILYK